MSLKPGDSRASDEQFLKLVADQTGYLSTQIDGGTESLSPTMWALVQYGPNRQFAQGYEIFVLHMPFNTPLEKRAVMSLLAASFCRDEVKLPLAIVFSSECWRSTFQDGEPQVLPVDDPQRRESILATGLTLDGREITATAPLIRQRGRIQPVSFETSAVLPTGTGRVFPFLHEFYRSLAGLLMKRQQARSAFRSKPNIN